MPSLVEVGPVGFGEDENVKRLKTDGHTDGQTFKTVHLAFQLWLAKHHLESYSILFVPFADTTETTTENKPLSKRSPLNPWKNQRETVNSFRSNGI